MHATTLPFRLPLSADLPCAIDLGAFAAHLRTLVDHRDPRGVRYPLAPLLTLAVCAKLAGHSPLTALAEWACLRIDDLAALLTSPAPRCPTSVLGVGCSPKPWMFRR